MLYDHSNRPCLQLLVNETRRKEVSGPALARAHREVGRALAVAAADQLTLGTVQIDHVAGPSEGVGFDASAAPMVLPMMRAGLFVAEGLWESLPGAALVPWTGPDSIAGTPVAGRVVFVVDSIINSGRSILEVVEVVRAAYADRVVVVSMTANADGLARCMRDQPDVDYVIGRVSQRSYVGRGSTDTGARLFGTTTWRAEAGD